MAGQVVHTWDGTFGEVECRVEVQRVGHETDGYYVARLSRLAFVVEGGEALGLWAQVRQADPITGPSADSVLVVATRRLEALYGRYDHEVA